MPGVPTLVPYTIAATFIGLGLGSFLAPRYEYGLHGLRLDGLSPSSTSPSPSSKPKPGSVESTAAADGDKGIVSPVMYIKSIRETSCGLLLAALQYRGNEAAITTLHAAVALVAAADGILVWTHGEERLRHRALGHFFASAALGWWARTRARPGLACICFGWAASSTAEPAVVWPG